METKQLDKRIISKRLQKKVISFIYLKREGFGATFP